MSRDELISRIIGLNPTAAPDFLTRFSEPQLEAYLRRLQGSWWVQNVATTRRARRDEPTNTRAA